MGRLLHGSMRSVILGAAPASGPDAAHTILTITDDGGGNAVFTTAAAHGIVSGAVAVNIHGTSSATYNALSGQGVDDAPTPTTFVMLGVYSGDATGGYWESA